MFSNKDVADYYNQTIHHYQKWWKLGQSKALHYGIWNEDTRNFAEALANTNRVMANSAGVLNGDLVLDAGCGVGGSGIFLAQNHQCKVEGLTLGEKLVRFGNQLIKKIGLEGQVRIQEGDYMNTPFPSETFDIVWACESMCHASNKDDFLKEAYRILKTGGRLVIADYFLTENAVHETIIKKWGDTWGIDTFANTLEFPRRMSTVGFSVKSKDYSKQIKRSAFHMYKAGLLGAIPSTLYNITHPKVSRFGKTHYKSGIYQYRALKRGLWKYEVMVGTKN